MSLRCPTCEKDVEPVSAPAVIAEELDTDRVICAYELDGWTPPRGVVEPPLCDIVYFCPMCRYVFATEEPDNSWLWINWNGIPVIVGKPDLPTLGVE